MSKDPEEAAATSDPNSAQPAPTGGTKRRVKKVKYRGPAQPNGSPPGKAAIGEMIRGILGVVGGLALAVWGGFMIKDGIHGEVAFTLNFGEHHSFDVKTAVVGIVVMLIGLAFAYFIQADIDWTTTSEPPAQADDPKPGGGA